MASNTSLSTIESLIRFGHQYTTTTAITPINETLANQSSTLLVNQIDVQTSTTSNLLLSTILPFTKRAVAAIGTTATTTAVVAATAATSTVTANVSNVPPEMSWMDWFSSARVQIPLYATILLLTLVGNSLVIMTLVQNRRMRTITNVFLLNLAVSDILLGVFCMPFTLIGTQLRDFVFGEVLCKLIPYLQGNSMKNKNASSFCMKFFFVIIRICVILIVLTFS